MIYYASPSGGNSAAGTIGDPASLTRALTLARGWIALGNANCTILCRDGYYFLSATWDITPADANITIQAYPRETPVFSGGTQITGAWSGPDANGVYSISWTGTTRDLWVNGLRATIARSSLNPAGFTKAGQGYNDANSLISVLARPQDVEIVGQSQWKFFKVRVQSAVGTTVTVRATDWNNSQFQSPYNLSAVWWYENAQELVKNGQGYWYHNRNTNTLYYKPRTGEVMGTVEVIAGRLEQLMSFTDGLGGADLNINFRGLNFAHTTWLGPDSVGYTPLQSGVLVAASNGSAYTKVPAAIPIYAIKGIRFWSCRLDHTGAAGWSMEYGAQLDVLHNCDTSDTAAAGIWVGDVTHLTEDPWPSDIRAKIDQVTVYNCKSDTPGAVYYDSAGTFCAYVSNLLFNHNEVTNAPYSGMCFGWGWGYNDPPGYGGSGWPAGFNAAPSVVTVNGNNTITNNKVTNYQQQLADSGGIYMNGRQDGTILSGNYVHAGNSGTYKFPFYLDNGARGITATGNVAAQAPTNWINLNASFQPFATYNTVTGNYADQGTVSAADGSNTISGNTVGAFGATPLAIIANAGRQ